MIEKSKLRKGNSPKTPHNVFVSFHKCDFKRKQEFVKLMHGRIIDASVDIGDILDTGEKTPEVRRIIRDDYIREATVIVVLIGRQTWQRKHVDWEIGGGLRCTRSNNRTGLLGIVLPEHPNHGHNEINPRLIPPRLAKNCGGDDPFAKVYDWPENFAPAQVQRAIAEALRRSKGTPPDNSYPPFARNRTTDWRKGWQS